MLDYSEDYFPLDYPGIYSEWGLRTQNEYLETNLVVIAVVEVVCWPVSALLWWAGEPDVDTQLVWFNQIILLLLIKDLGLKMTLFSLLLNKLLEGVVFKF